MEKLHSIHVTGFPTVFFEALSAVTPLHCLLRLAEAS